MSDENMLFDGMSVLRAAGAVRRFHAKLPSDYSKVLASFLFRLAISEGMG